MMELEYKVLWRTGRNTSVHESEELEEFLNKQSAEGWALHTMHRIGIEGMQQCIIFYRVKK